MSSRRGKRGHLQRGDTALLCLALDDRPLFLTEATRILFQQLSPASRALLGVPGTAATEQAYKAAYRRVRYCFAAIGSVMDPSPLPKNRRLTGQDLKARTTPMTPAQAEAARGRLEAFLNALLEASISVLTDEEHTAFDGFGQRAKDAHPVLLCFDGSDDAATAIAKAGELLGPRAAVVLTVWEPAALWVPYDPATILTAPPVEASFEGTRPR